MSQALIHGVVMKQAPVVKLAQDVDKSVTGVIGIAPYESNNK